MTVSKLKLLHCVNSILYEREYYITKKQYNSVCYVIITDVPLIGNIITWNGSCI